MHYLLDCSQVLTERVHKCHSVEMWPVGAVNLVRRHIYKKDLRFKFSFKKKSEEKFLKPDPPIEKVGY